MIANCMSYDENLKKLSKTVQSWTQKTTVVYVIYFLILEQNRTRSCLKKLQNLSKLWKMRCKTGTMCLRGAATRDIRKS